MKRNIPTHKVFRMDVYDVRFIYYRLRYMHLEIAKGSYNDKRAYIQGPYEAGKFKPLNPTFMEQGTRPTQGNRTDIHEVFL
jgi:hypothetical protein